jgi:hypothetical protein
LANVHHCAPATFAAAGVEKASEQKQSMPCHKLIDGGRLAACQSFKPAAYSLGEPEH